MNTASNLVRLASMFGFITIAASAFVGCGQAPGESTGQQSEAVTVDLGNAFYDPPAGGQATQCTVRAPDGSSTTMHCCPSGYAMIGAHVGDNAFKCAKLLDTTGVRRADKRTVRNGVHSCPFGQVMVGLRNDQNVLACQTIPSNPIVSELTDSGTQDAYPMHVCNADGANDFVTMTGISVSQNLFNCGQNASSGGGTGGGTSGGTGGGTSTGGGPSTGGTSSGGCGFLGSCTKDSQCGSGNACRNGCCVIG